MSKVAKRLRVAVVGGSLGGLLAANLLLRAGHEVTVHEQIPDELSGRGAGIATHKELLNALELAGAVVDPTVGISIEQRIVLGMDGSIIARHRYPQIFTSWGRLYRLLKDAFPSERYFSGMAFTHTEIERTTLRVHFADGKCFDADLLVGADGLRSTVRGQILQRVTPKYAGYIAWRGLVDESQISNNTHATFFDRLAFFLPPNEQMLGYPVAGYNDEVTPGNKRYNFVWYRPADVAEALPRMLTDDLGNYHEGGIPPKLVSKSVISEMWHDAERLLAPEFFEIVNLTRQPFLQPIVDLEVPYMASKRIVLLGDAAYVARPHTGMGVTKAAGDAVTLANAIKENPGDLQSAIALYNDKRSKIGRSIVALARRLGSPMKRGNLTIEEMKMATRYRNPQFVLHDTAVPPDQIS